MPRKTPVKGKNTPQKVGSVKKAPPKPVEPEEDSSEEESEEEQMEIETAKMKKKPAMKQNGNTAADDDDDEEEDDEEDSDEEEEEEAAVAMKPKKAAGKEKKVVKTVKPEDDDEEDSDDDDDADDDDDKEKPDEDESEDDEEEEGEKSGKKRKVPTEKTEKAQKKAKVEGQELVRLYITLADDEDKKPVEKSIQKLFKKNDLEISNFAENESKNGRYWLLDVSSGDVDKAIGLTGNDLKGSTIKIVRSRQRELKDKDNCVLFVKNLPFSSTNDDVMEEFPGCKSVRMPQKHDGSIKGFAFLEYETEDEVQAAFKAKQGAQMGNNVLTVDYVGPKSKNAPSKAQSRNSVGEAGKTKVLFVKNLSFDLDTDSFKDEFEGAESARIATFADSGKPRGFGFVTFATPELCSAAYESMQGASIQGREVVVDYATEQSRGGGGGGFGRGGGRGGRGGFRGRGGGGGFGGRGRGDFRGGRGGRGGRGRGGFSSPREFQGTRKILDDDSD